MVGKSKLEPAFGRWGFNWDGFRSVLSSGRWGGGFLFSMKTRLTFSKHLLYQNKINWGFIYGVLLFF